MLVSLIGTWAKWDSCKEEHYFTSGLVDASRMYHTKKADHSIVKGALDLQHVIHREKVPMFDSMVPIHIQLTGMSWIRLHCFYRAVNQPGARLIQIKTDSVFTECGRVPNLVDRATVMEKLGGYRTESLPLSFNEVAPIKMPQRMKVETEQWSYHNVEDILELGSVMITGKAGTGKSFLVRELANQRLGRYQLLAPTNIAAN